MELLGGRYARERVIGRGGMGSVWLGTDEVLRRSVALKELGPDAGAAASREARLAATVSHPHVVPVFDLLVDDGRPWLVMQYVDGPTLTQFVAAEGPLGPDEAAVLLRQVADALQAAHDAGVVHRDVKPSNVLLASAERAMLTDFGVARTSDATVTNGVLTASPAYLAPEVAAGSGSTPASDVWSLGATLFHMLTGSPPYEVVDGNVIGLLYRIVEQDPPRTDRAGWLTPLLVGTMTKDPQKRWTLEQVRSFLGGERHTQRLPVLPGRMADTAERPAVAPTHRVARSAAAVPWWQDRSRWPVAALIAAAITLVVFVVALLASRGGEGSPSAEHTSQPPTSATSGPSSKAPSATASGTSPTPDGVTGFVKSYVATAAADPAQGYAMLTPAYQRASGGLTGYRNFWGNVTNVKSLGDIRPTMNPLSVSYTYTYTLKGGGKRTEDVHLRLVFQDGHYLIAGD